MGFITVNGSITLDGFITVSGSITVNGFITVNELMAFIKQMVSLHWMETYVINAGKTHRLITVDRDITLLEGHTPVDLQKHTVSEDVQGD